MNKLWNSDIIRIQTVLKGQMRLVGGCVRDFLLGKMPHDWDIATPIPPEQVQHMLNSAGIQSVPISLFHGVVSAVVGLKSYEITTLRQDIYKGRKTTIRWVDDYAIDAFRRDFTINALSMDIDGNVYDYTNGQSDLKNHIVRFIGDPEQRISEDPLRICRYVRFWSLYGTEDPDKTILEIGKRYVPGLNKSSRERRHKELMKVLMSPKVLSAIMVLERIGVLNYLVSKPDTEKLKILLKDKPNASTEERLNALKNNLN